MNSSEVKYWQEFYSAFNNVSPSPFAKFILEYFHIYDMEFKLLDVGCGNGRDAYFLSSKYNTTGIDISNSPKNSNNCTFVLGDMIKFDKTGFDIIYSRFTYHSIDDEQQEELVRSIQPESFLCIETRSIKGLNTFHLHGDSHYRNLTCLESLVKLLRKYNFDILYCVESNGFAVYKNEDPICIRVICKKNKD